jgi:hypothetical protein
MVWSEKVLTDIRIEEPVEWDMRLAARASMDIRDLLSIIGHGVTISSVEAREYERDIAAAYHLVDRRIIVESSNEFADETLLYVMGHECAHAMLIQGDLLEHNSNLGSYQHLVHEVAADVLGAHLAGRVHSSRGGGGEALTDWDGNVRTYLGDGYWLDANDGAERLIDAVDQICRENEDLWKAARIIADELHNVDEKTARKLAPADDWRPKR